jgi:hypothetical protein
MFETRETAMSDYLKIIELLGRFCFSLCDVVRNDDGSISIILNKIISESELIETETFCIEESNPDYEKISALMALLWDL